MTTFELACGERTVSIDVPERNLIGVLEGKEMPTISLRQAFHDAWEHPVGMTDPVEIFGPGETVVIVVTDHTRATPTREIVPLLWEKIRGTVAKEDVTLLIATGIHRAPTEDEMKTMLGDLRHEFRVLIHDCDRDTVEIGRSHLGTPIAIHRALVEADRIVSIGHIGMHYYAGYSGGRKNILPGVASRATIEANHALLTDPRSMACAYGGNPISEEMVEAARMAGLDLIIDVIFARDGRVGRIVIGDPEEAHAVGRAVWDKHFHVSFQEPFDVVIASAGGHPKDINLYQAYKAQFNAMRTLREGGILLLVAACKMGIGNAVFEEWIHRTDSPEDVFAIYEQEGFVLGGHKAVYHARDLSRATIFLFSDLDDTTVRRFYMEPADDARRVFAAAQKRFGEDYRVLVIPHAADTFPVRDEASHGRDDRSDPHHA